MESVWDYPRPPRTEPCVRHVRVEIGGELLAESGRALRVLETASPPTVYIPAEDVRMDRLSPSRRRHTLCEWKGRAAYYDAGDIEAVAWHYPDPKPEFAQLRDHVAFYPGRADCWLDDERVRPQQGDYYGGWITDDIRGPFKGAAGTAAW